VALKEVVAFVNCSVLLVVFDTSETLWRPWEAPTVIPPTVIPLAWTFPERTRRFASSMLRNLSVPFADISTMGGGFFK
jgi:hypothetical protein